MKDNLSLKLVAVIDSVRMILYDAKGVKIISKALELALTSEKHHHHNKEKRDSHYQNKSSPGSLFEPHTAPKDLEQHEAAKMVSEYLEKIINDIQNKYKSLIIVADPKMLGHVRQTLSNNLKKIVEKEFAKDLINHSSKSIEQIIFT